MKKMNNDQILKIMRLTAGIVLTAAFLCACAGQKEPAAEAPAATTYAETKAAAVESPVITAHAETRKTTPPETTQAAVDWNAKVTGYRYCTGTDVNVRTGAGTDYAVAGKLDINQKVGVLGVSGEWVNIVFNNASCYVKGDFLTEDAEWQKKLASANGYKDGEAITLNPAWKYADYSKIHTGSAKLTLAKNNRKNIVVGVNAGHGTQGGSSVKTQCHPDGTAKVTGGSTAAGSITATAVSGGMTFADGTAEPKVTLKVAQKLRDILLEKGYDVLMIREGDDVQLDNIARTVICNNVANCHIAIHFDGDGLGYDKGCYFMSVPDGIKYMEPVASTWQASEALGSSMISGLKNAGCKIFGDGTLDEDLTQTSYSSVPSIDIELGNQCSDHSDAYLSQLAQGLADGVQLYFGK